jgi:hypothetical protein
MSPEEAVNALVAFLSTQKEFDEEEAYAALEAAEVPAEQRQLAYQFTQIAWSRVLLDGMGIKFSPEYVLFSGEGEPVESGELETNPYYNAACAAGGRQPPPVGLAHLAMMSAEVHAVNNALNGGSRAENLVMGPIALFTDHPSPEGMERVQAHIRDAAKQAAGTVRKPWWKVW